MAKELSPLRKKFNRVLKVTLLVMILWLFFPFVPFFSLPSFYDPAFEGDSEKLRHTQVVPVLNTQVEDHKNILWTTGLRASWKRLQKEINES